MLIFTQDFTVCSSGYALGYVSGNLCNFARGFYAAFVSLSLLSDVACGLLFGSKVLEDAGSGFVHRDKFSPRVPVCSFISQVSMYILLYFPAYLWEICRLSFVGGLCKFYWLLSCAGCIYRC